MKVEELVVVGLEFVKRIPVKERNRNQKIRVTIKNQTPKRRKTHDAQKKRTKLK